MKGLLFFIQFIGFHILLRGSETQCKQVCHRYGELAMLAVRYRWHVSLRTDSGDPDQVLIYNYTPLLYYYTFMDSVHQIQAGLRY